MDDVYKVLNKIQMSGKARSFSVDKSISPVIENLVKDLKLTYKKTHLKKKDRFRVNPPVEPEEEFLVEADFFRDEVDDND